MPQDYKTIAQNIINRRTTKIPLTSIGVNTSTETLGADLAVQSLSYLLAVAKVFDLLTSSYDRTFTGYYFIKNTSDAVLLRLAGYKQGNALLSSISKWVGNNLLTQGGK